MVNSFFEEKAEKLLIEANCFELPIDIKKCAEYFNVKVQALALDEDVSGFFVIKDNAVHIGYNIKDGHQRSRFTIAHELSHYFLHAKETPLFVDKNRTLYRDSNSSTGELIKEREANAFAAALLMPRKLIDNIIDQLSENDKKALHRKLASTFNVSVAAMGIRLVNLGIIDYY
jgi:Zn-dependent peptidase ImmA (M78 family)